MSGRRRRDGGRDRRGGRGGRGGSRHRGTIISLKDRFGFIRSTSSQSDVFFHYSEVQGAAFSLEVNDCVEFELFPSRGGKMNAAAVRLVPRFSCEDGEVVEEGVAGTIKSDGLILPDGKETAADCVPYGVGDIADDLGSVQLRVGDRVTFDLLRSAKSEGSRNVRLLEPGGEGRAEGIISGLRDSFGFIRRLDEEGRVFFHFSELLGDEADLRTGAEVTFDIGLDTKSRQGRGRGREREREREPREVAQRVTIVADGTLVRETVVEEGAVGIVQRVGRSDMFDKRKPTPSTIVYTPSKPPPEPSCVDDSIRDALLDFFGAVGEENMFFPASMPAKQLRYVKALAVWLGMAHQLMGEGADRELRVYKTGRSGHDDSEGGGDGGGDGGDGGGDGGDGKAADEAAAGEAGLGPPLEETSIVFNRADAVDARARLKPGDEVRFTTVVERGSNLMRARKLELLRTAAQIKADRLAKIMKLHEEVITAVVVRAVPTRRHRRGRRGDRGGASADGTGQLEVFWAADGSLCAPPLPKTRAELAAEKAAAAAAAAAAGGGADEFAAARGRKLKPSRSDAKERWERGMAPPAAAGEAAAAAAAAEEEEGVAADASSEGDAEATVAAAVGESGEAEVAAEAAADAAAEVAADAAVAAAVAAPEAEEAAAEEEKVEDGSEAADGGDEEGAAVEPEVRKELLLFRASSVVEGSEKPVEGDVVELQVQENTETGQRTAVNVRVVAEATRRLGMVVSLKDSFGFLRDESTAGRRRRDSSLNIFFHFTDVRSDEPLEEYSWVEYLPTSNARSGGEKVAVRLSPAAAPPRAKSLRKRRKNSLDRRDGGAGGSDDSAAPPPSSRKPLNKTLKKALEASGATPSSLGVLAKGPDGTRGFAAGRGKPLSS